MTLTKRTYSCAPTLTDDDVIWFCRNGYWILEGVVPDEINRRGDGLSGRPSDLGTLRDPGRGLVHRKCNLQSGGGRRGALPPGRQLHPAPC